MRGYELNCMLVERRLQTCKCRIRSIAWATCVEEGDALRRAELGITKLGTECGEPPAGCAVKSGVMSRRRGRASRDGVYLVTLFRVQGVPLYETSALTWKRVRPCPLPRAPPRARAVPRHDVQSTCVDNSPTRTLQIHARSSLSREAGGDWAFGLRAVYCTELRLPFMFRFALFDNALHRRRVYITPLKRRAVPPCTRLEYLL